jgi:hypothetical protein
VVRSHRYTKALIGDLLPVSHQRMLAACGWPPSAASPSYGCQG